jgi:hypothetical protein
MMCPTGSSRVVSSGMMDGDQTVQRDTDGNAVVERFGRYVNCPDTQDVGYVVKTVMESGLVIWDAGTKTCHVKNTFPQYCSVHILTISH